MCKAIQRRSVTSSSWSRLCCLAGGVDRGSRGENRVGALPLIPVEREHGRRGPVGVQWVVAALLIVIRPGQVGDGAGGDDLEPEPLAVGEVLDQAKRRPTRWQDRRVQRLGIQTVDDRHDARTLGVQEVDQGGGFWILGKRHLPMMPNPVRT